MEYKPQRKNHRKTWIDVVNNDLKRLEVENCCEVIQDRDR